MKTEIMTLCEYASENNGRLTIADAFDDIIAAKFPWRAYFFMASRINLSGCEINFKTVAIKIISATEPSKVVFETDSPFEQAKDVRKLNMVAGFKGLIFTECGDYLLLITLDDKVVAECPFKVILKGNE